MLFTIESMTDGSNVVIYPGNKAELIPPADHDLKMDWIRESFRTFFNHVCVADVLPPVRGKG